MLYISDKTFDRENYTETPLARAEYDNCTFRDCIFSGAALGGIVFSECVFDTCNLSSAVLAQTALRSVTFRNCKMLGLRFDVCDPFLFSIMPENCQLDLASFYRRKMRKTVFRNCSLKEADFAEADLGGAAFIDCDLSEALFDQSMLEKTDFRRAFHYIIDPEKNRMKGARFSNDGLSGLLQNYDLQID